MAKVVSNMVINGTSGVLGSQLCLRRLSDGRTILCKIPNFSRRVLSSAQKAHHLRFREASAYARQAARREPLYAQLASGTMCTAYNLALADWFNPPEIRRIELRNGLIRVCASDKIHVAGVRVALRDADAGYLEEGPATRLDELWWQYAPARRPIPGQHISADAWDLAGNHAGLERDA